MSGLTATNTTSMPWDIATSLPRKHTIISSVTWEGGRYARRHFLDAVEVSLLNWITAHIINIWWETNETTAKFSFFCMMFRGYLGVIFTLTGCFAPSMVISIWRFLGAVITVYMNVKMDLGSNMSN